MEWIAVTVVAALLVSWITYRLQQPTTAAQHRKATIAALRKAQLAAVADQVDNALSETRHAKVAALDYLETHAPPELKTAVLPLRADDATDGAILMSVAKIERQVTTPGYRHVRHHLRKVLLPADRVVLLAGRYAASASDEGAEALTRAIAGLEQACAELRQLAVAAKESAASADRIRNGAREPD
jgi:hypothetical protein